MTPEQHQAWLQMTPGGRAAAEFARAATFDPSKWEPYVTKRKGDKHPKGTPGFRHTTSGKFITREELPDEYMAHDGKVAHERDVSSVTVPVNYTMAMPMNNVAVDPVHDYHALVVRGQRPPRKQANRLARLALVGMARLHEKEMDPAVGGILSQAEEFADSPKPRPDGMTAVDANRDLQATTYHPAHRAIASVFTSGDGINNLTPSVALGRYVGGSLPSYDQTFYPPEVKSHAKRLAQVLRSVYHSGPSLPIPISPQIRSLARAAYNNSSRDHMKILSDALEEKSAHPHVLANLRHPDSAVRGNWVLDHILGKR